MKPLSERIKTFPASQFIDWLCLACVDVREVHTPYDAQEEINKIREALTERLSTLQEQLTATTNSLTNAQEALKSAGIEADTVQAGVMELVSRMNQVVAENKVLDGALGAIADAYETGMADLLAKEIDTAVNIETTSTDAYLNAVRAESVDKAIEHLHNKFTSTGHVGVPVMALEWLATQLRAGNAGKDGSHE